MNRTSISWTEFTWNPVSGCKKISPGCAFCYAEAIAERYRGQPAFPNGFALTLRPHKLGEPLRLRAPSLIFVNSTSDFFWSDIPDSYRDAMVDVMEATPQHQYQVLTKRTDELLRYSTRRNLPGNFWAGVSIESQRYAARADALRRVRAAVRFISAEPLLGPLAMNLAGIDWLIAGGESGAHLSQSPKLRAARALVTYEQGKWIPRADRIVWVRALRDQCAAGGVAFLFKQWGGLRPDSGGRLLDGVTWEQFPGVHSLGARAPRAGDVATEHQWNLGDTG